MYSLSPRCFFRWSATLIILSVVHLCLLHSSSAESLKITSNPPGATVELDGVPVGVTPFDKEFPGGYFHRTHTVIGKRLEHAMFARLSLAGWNLVISLVLLAVTAMGFVRLRRAGAA